MEAVRTGQGKKVLVLTDCQSVVKALEKGAADGLPTGGVVGRIWAASRGSQVAII